MHLEEIRIQNYRSIDDVTLRFPLNKPVVLFGPNNAGKTNILSAILTLRRYDPRYLEEGKFHPMGGSKAMYTTSLPNAPSIILPNLDSLTKKFANFGSPSRGLSAKTEITLTVGWGDYRKDGQRKRIVFGFNECGDNNWLPYVKNKEVLLKLAKYTRPLIRIWESGFGDSKNYLDYLKTVQGVEDNDLPNWFIKLIPKIDKIVSKSTGGIKDFDDLFQDGNPFSVGSGQQAYVSRLGDLAAGKIIGSMIANVQLVLIDEPETHLHPNAREALLEEIREACGEGIQVIYTTHSENFLDADDLEGFVRVYKENVITKVRQLTDDELSSTCDKKLPIGDYWSVKLNSDQLKGFFADVILLVEGQTEQYALPIYLTRSFLSENGIQIVPCHSKSAIPTYWRLFTAYGYKCFIVFDYDDDIPPKLKKRAQEAETQEKKNAIQGEIKKEREKNQNLENLCKFKESPFCLYTMSSLGSCFKNNWESYFEEALERDYQDIWSNLQKIIDDFSNKALDAKAIAQEVKNKGYNMPPFITAIKARLRGLSEMSEDQYQRLIKKTN